MRAIILDVETTGIVEPQVIELAYMGPLEFGNTPQPVQRLRFKPSKPISTGALATHHIIAEDLVNEPPWPGTWPLPLGSDFLIAHNVDFDWQAIGSPQVRRICTLTLARNLWPEVDSHSLAALIYQFFPHREARELLRNAHDAGTDVELCTLLLVQLFAMLPPMSSWEELWQHSERARVPTRFTFGKYGPADGKPGRLITEIRRSDPGYVEWCLYKCDMCRDEYWQRALRGQA
jgi:exodeoxyribonuclease X